MAISNRIRPDGENYERKTLFRHGILALPLSVMLMFGLLGFRLGQLFNKIIGCVINLMFFFNKGLILSVTISRFINVKDNHETIDKFFTCFDVLMTVKFTPLIYMYFQRFNLGMLLESITKKRKHDSSKKELLFVIIIFIVVVTMAIYVILYFSYRFVLPVLITGVNRHIFAFKSKDPLTSRIAAILESLIFMSITWTSVLATSFLLKVIAVVLRREFG